jgi:hypothetical protein
MDHRTSREEEKRLAAPQLEGGERWGAPLKVRSKSHPKLLAVNIKLPDSTGQDLLILWEAVQRRKAGASL